MSFSTSLLLVVCDIIKHTVEFLITKEIGINYYWWGECLKPTGCTHKQPKRATFYFIKQCNSVPSRICLVTWEIHLLFHGIVLKYTVLVMPLWLTDPFFVCHCSKSFIHLTFPVIYGVIILSPLTRWWDLSRSRSSTRTGWSSALADILVAFKWSSAKDIPKQRSLSLLTCPLVSCPPVVSEASNRN